MRNEIVETLRDDIRVGDIFLDDSYGDHIDRPRRPTTLGLSPANAPTSTSARLHFARLGRTTGRWDNSTVSVQPSSPHSVTISLIVISLREPGMPSASLNPPPALRPVACPFRDDADRTDARTRTCPVPRQPLGPSRGGRRAQHLALRLHTGR